MSNTREALIAEALGDIGALLDRVEAVAPALEATCGRVTSATAALAAGAGTAEARFAAFTEHATAQVIKHVAGRSAEMARKAAELETRAMQAAARDMFRHELEPVLIRLARVLDSGLIRRDSWLGSWQAHALTTIAASASTWLAAVLVLPGR